MEVDEQPIASTSKMTSSTHPSTSTKPSSHLRRVHITEQGLHKAADSVLKVLSHESMVQCFPEFLPVFVETYGEEQGRIQFDRLVESLKEVLITHYKEGIPLAWADMCQTWNWIEKANELDEIVERARIEKEQGTAPRNMYAKGADARITVPSKTVPALRNATAELKARRLTLEEDNKKTFERITQDQLTLVRTEGQIKQIIEDFAQAMETLSSVDLNTLSELQDQIVQALPADAVA